ncbi:sarcosine oxidase subunit gamma [Mangrovibacter plantisponsor]|uniref:Heterotetrameric sarcosine oxidase gamma subunit n=1 Tax=Mangrovibacter plantisponsor TaxID=451513 RepID=A0A317Q7V9_9ENTR|nr:sarcosine oxidase subunit gamma family protein [Mangrovibacter plantisponsor]PWW12651.1 heterotetrameric sarcosine oxidase gamma subunit [Mangrovibacter plantisponsor]
MSETIIPETKSRDTVRQVAVMNQKAEGAVRAESPLYHAELGKLATQSPREGGVTLRELGLLGHLIVRGSQSNQSFMQGCAEVLGTALPVKPLTSTEEGDISVRWLSPDEWLVVMPMNQIFPVEEALRATIQGHYSVVNVSGGQTILLLSGKNAIDVLKKSTVLDLHPSAFPVGKVAASVFAKSSAIIRRTGEESWELVIRRSFADYIWLWVQDASHEYGLIMNK